MTIHHALCDSTVDVILQAIFSRTGDHGLQRDDCIRERIITTMRALGMTARLIENHVHDRAAPRRVIDGATYVATGLTPSGRGRYPHDVDFYIQTMPTKPSMHNRNLLVSAQ